MNSFFTLIKLDYLQRTRTYGFLITLCATLAIAYSFVPEPHAAYSTIRIDNYVGFYNSAWFGYVTAMMTTVFLSLIGFYLVNSGIQTDTETNVGQIVATTRIGNFRYLLAKAGSNFLLLATIALLVFGMSILLFFMYHDGYSLELLQFIKPYVFITFPALFCIAILAVIFEVFLGKYTVLQNSIFFFLFSMLMVTATTSEAQHASDILGIHIVIQKMEQQVKAMTNSNENGNLSIGYTINTSEKPLKFEFTGIVFSPFFILSRVLWMCLMLGVLWGISFRFHRFQGKKRSSKRKKSDVEAISTSLVQDIALSELPSPTLNFSVMPLIKTEFLLLCRKGNIGLWGLHFLGILLLVVLPLSAAHSLVLPVVWFVQVRRLSDLGAKETTNNLYYFSSMAYKPLGRVLSSQILAGFALMLLTALPLLLRLLIVGKLEAAIAVVVGALFLVVLAMVLGRVSKGKKLFEVFFFMLSYANINGLVFADYFGAFTHREGYLLQLTMLTFLLTGFCFGKRWYDLGKV